MWCVRGAGAGSGAVLVLVLLVLLALRPSAGAAAGGPVCPPRAARDNRCRESDSAETTANFFINGGKLSIGYQLPGYVLFECKGNVTLDDPAVLPSFPAHTPVSPITLTVQKCPVPSAASYTDALAALGVSTAGTKIMVLRELPVYPPLLPAHLRHLPKLDHLHIMGTEPPPPLPRSDALFSELTALRRLDLSSLTLLPIDMNHLPTELVCLTLSNMGIRNMSAEVLGRLPNLKLLSVREMRRNVTVDVGAARNLTSVTVQGGAAPRHPRLQRVAVYEWSEPAPAPWTRCAALRSLMLDSTLGSRAARVQLPEAWLAQCPRLRSLWLQRLPLGEVPPRLLAGATELRELKLIQCRLTALPEGLLNDTKRLELLDLSQNNLHTLPSALLSGPLPALGTLQLSGNQLRGGALAALRALRPRAALTVLDLSDNPLGELCPEAAALDVPNDESPLGDMPSLAELRLHATGARRVCPAWHRLPALSTLDLSNNSVAELTLADMQWNSTEILVNLLGNQIESVLVSEHDDTSAIFGVTMKIDSRIRCDCESVALQSEKMVAAFNPALKCRGPLVGFEQRAVPLQLLQCVDQSCPAGCRCLRLGDDVVLACERGGLLAVPPPPGPGPGPRPRPRPRHLHLRLAHNRITALRAADLPPDLQTLDLRNNSLEHLDADVLEALFGSSGRRVLLSDNPLDCSCGARGAALVAALLRHRDRVFDIDSVRCSNTHLLLSETPEPRCWGALAGAAAGALAAAAALAGAAAGARRAGRRLRRALRKLGLLRDRERRPYDAFVSFSHRDERFVVEELVARLERGGYRLCLHYRDWAPGAWIPAQIAASVRSSRRTIAVVSEHFLRSDWARVEFREAHAAALRSSRPRLVVVLLAEPSALLAEPSAARAGAELRAFLAANTYVRRDDPYFWSKLQRALPRPHGPARAPAPGAPAAGPTREASAPAAPDSPPAATVPPPPALDSPAADTVTSVIANDSRAATPVPPTAATVPPALEPVPPAAAAVSPLAPPIDRTGLARIFPILSFRFPKFYSGRASDAVAGDPDIFTVQAQV